MCVCVQDDCSPLRIAAFTNLCPANGKAPFNPRWVKTRCASGGAVNLRTEREEEATGALEVSALEMCDILQRILTN